MKLRPTPLLALAASLAFLTVLPPQARAEAKEHAAAKHKEGKPPTASSLVLDMKKSVAFIAKNSKDKISVKSKEAVPYWLALKDTCDAIDQIDAGVKAGDGTMLAGLDSLGMSLHQLVASWGVLRGSVKGGQIGSGVIALAKAYEVFLFNYGPSVARKHIGGEVSAAEKEQLAAARAEIASLKAQMTSVDGKVKDKTYQKRFIKDVLALCAESEELKGDDLKTYCAYIFQYNRLIYTAVAYNTLIDVWYPETGKELASAPSRKKRPTLAFEKSCGGYYKGWKYATVPVAHYGDYYEVTTCITTISETEITSFESYTESYSEETATEEISEETSSINEEVSMEEEDSSFADEVADGEDDQDGDGVEDEADTDDDNDGASDEADNDDDNDGVMDSEDSADEEADEDADDDGSADDMEEDSGDDGGGEMEEDSGDDAGDSGDDGGDSGGDDGGGEEE